MCLVQNSKATVGSASEQPRALPKCMPTLSAPLTMPVVPSIIDIISGSSAPLLKVNSNQLKMSTGLKRLSEQPHPFFRENVFPVSMFGEREIVTGLSVVYVFPAPPTAFPSSSSTVTLAAQSPKLRSEEHTSELQSP